MGIKKNNEPSETSKRTRVPNVDTPVQQKALSNKSRKERYMENKY
jgi:hypothetical protein